jgi:hypothetical protein
VKAIRPVPCMGRQGFFNWEAGEERAGPRFQLQQLSIL